MYIPPHFQEVGTDEIAAIIAAAPLACIVAQTAEGLIANHIPLLSAPDGGLIGHVALANDLHRLIADGQEVLAIFRGEDGFVEAPARFEVAHDELNVVDQPAAVEFLCFHGVLLVAVP